MAKCLLQIRAKPHAERKTMAAVVNTNIEAMPKVYCNRFVDALASGRMTYEMYKDAHSLTADRSKFIKIIQGR
jgi:hypothetical protein